DRVGASKLLGEPIPRLRADVEAEPTVRQVVVRTDFRFGICVERGGGDNIGRQHDLEVERIRAAQLFGHLAADQNRVRLAAQVTKHAELVLDLGAAGDEHERPLDVAKQLSELLQLALEQQSG